MRILIGNRLRIGNLNRVEHFYDFALGLFFLHTAVNYKRLGYLLFNRKNGIQRRHRFLEDNRYFIASDLIQVVEFHFRKVFAFKKNFARIYISVSVEKP